ncbi:MAG: DUF2911 domain-containing protein [Gemmatimonadota bacterium]
MRMRLAAPLVLLVTLGVAWPGASAAQDPECAPMADRMPLEDRTSPYDSVEVAVGEGMAKVCYGRPALRGRTMIGGETIPYGELWRTGANEPTTLHVNVPARVAGIEVGPGSYSVYTIPEEGDSWTLILNRSITQWGHEGAYTEEVAAQEIGRASVRAERLDEAVERLTIRPMGGGLVLEWQNTRVRIPITPA